MWPLVAAVGLAAPTQSANAWIVGRWLVASESHDRDAPLAIQLDDRELLAIELFEDLEVVASRGAIEL